MESFRMRTRPTLAKERGHISAFEAGHWDQIREGKEVCYYQSCWVEWNWVIL